MTLEDDIEFELPLGIIPRRIWNNYKERVKRFYKTKGSEDIESYTEEIKKQKNVKVRLVWDETRGLRSVSLGWGGLDLDENEGRYIFHNIYNMESPEAIALFEIAKRYISLLN